MPIYYVSAQRGLDTNDGLSSGNPWLTITKAVQIVAPGDIVYIGPGTYREKIYLATAGTEANPIKWIPDSSVRYVTGDNQGIIRITGCDINEYPTPGIVWTGWVDYNSLGDENGGFGQIYIDGSSDCYSVDISGGSGRKYFGVVAHGHKGIGGGINTNCIAIGGHIGFWSGIDTNCIAMGGHIGFYSGTHINCVGICGQRCFYHGTNTNCTGIGSHTGFYHGTNTNCIAMGSYYGYYGNSSEILNNHCRATACCYGFYGSNAELPMDISTCSHTWCYLNALGDGYDTGDSSNAKAVIYDLALIAQTIQPLLQFNRNDGDNTVSIGAYDILGHLRRLGNGIIDLGAVEHSLVNTEYTELKNISPAIKVESAGMKLFEVPAKTGEEITIKVWTKHVNTTGDKPQIILKGKSITEQTATNTSANDTWELLTVYATPDVDEILNLVLYARDTAASAVSYFSDIKVS